MSRTALATTAAAYAAIASGRMGHISSGTKMGPHNLKKMLKRRRRDEIARQSRKRNRRKKVNRAMA